MGEGKKGFVGGIYSTTCQATWPFANLSVSPDLIEIRILGFKKYSFRPGQVIGFTERRRMRGIQIHHNVYDYPSFILFGSLRNPTRILSALNEIGFVAQGKGKIDDIEYEMNRIPGYAGLALLILFVFIWLVMTFFTR